MASNRPPRFPQERRRPFVQFRGFTSSGNSRHTNPLVFAGAAACPLLLITYDVILRAFKVWLVTGQGQGDGVKGGRLQTLRADPFLGWCINNERPP